jgi:hypothetical protein
MVYCRVEVPFLQHAMMRGNEMRLSQWCDWFKLKMAGVGPTPCIVLVMVSRQGKTNKVWWALICFDLYFMMITDALPYTAQIYLALPYI